MLATDNIAHNPAYQGLYENSPWTNVGEHRGQGDGKHHALERESLAERMLRQLADNPDACYPLGKQGARGALFNLILELYGYTFVGKGTVLAFKAILQYEGLPWEHLSCEEADEVIVPMSSKVEVATELAVKKLRDYGVEHNDVRPSNLLRNSEIGIIMLVDFERSKILADVGSSRDIAEPEAEDPSL